MCSQRREADDWGVEDGASDETGVAMTPADLVDDDTEARPSRPTAMPKGLPITPERYRAMKEEASRGDSALGNVGQQDPSTADEDPERT